MSFSGGGGGGGWTPPPIGNPVWPGLTPLGMASHAPTPSPTPGAPRQAPPGLAGGANNFSAAATPANTSAAATPQTIGDAFVNPVGFGTAQRQLTSPKGGKATLGE